MPYPPEIRRALRIIIAGQCAGTAGPLLFGNGFMLAGFMTLSLLMASALGLVPTLRHIRSQWLPQNRC